MKLASEFATAKSTSNARDESSFSVTLFDLIGSVKLGQLQASAGEKTVIAQPSQPGWNVECRYDPHPPTYERYPLQRFPIVCVTLISRGALELHQWFLVFTLTTLEFGPVPLPL
jgi:hypothetical protein